MIKELLLIHTNKTDDTLGSNMVGEIMNFIKEFVDEAYEGTLTTYQDGLESYSTELSFMTDQNAEYYQMHYELTKDFFEYYFDYKQYTHDEDEFDYKLEIVNGDKVDYCKISIRTIIE